MAEGFVNKGYKVISGGTDNHSMLIDLRSKSVTGKDAENALVLADITVNKNMVPFDTESPFVTSGIRVGTSAITSRGVNEEEVDKISNSIITNAYTGNPGDGKIFVYDVADVIKISTAGKS